MTELTFEEFKTIYKPVKQHQKHGLAKYLLEVFSEHEVEASTKKIIKHVVNRINFQKALCKYVMYVWTHTVEGTLVPGRRVHNALGYIICEEPFDITMINEITIKLNNSNE
jgi:hypothetical protein